jgi:ribonuclease BN (tRNA processing enzyme)
MDVTVLGAGGTWPAPGGATSGYLVRHDGFCLWIDAGTGTLSRLQQHIALSEVDTVLVTHGHPDHFVDLYPAFYARYYGQLGTPGLPLYAPSDFFGHFAELVSDDSRDLLRVCYSVRDADAGEAFEAGPFRIVPFEMTHVGVRSLGYRIEVGGSTLAYTGDTGPSDEVVKLASGADLFVCEATWQDGMDLLPFHMSARQAGEHATRAGVARLVLTHLWPSHDREAALDQGKEAFDGPTELAREDMHIEVGS